jgi:outer membrane protein insertion porin family
MRRVRLALAGLLLAGPLAAAPPDPASAPDPVGRTVESVSWVCDGPVDEKTVNGLIGITAGRPLLEVDTGNTIRDLYGTLLFSEIAVNADVLDDGRVAVIVYLRRAYRVRSISFHGRKGLSSEELRRTIAFAEGQPFVAATLDAGADAIARRLSTEGFLQATVEPEAVFDEKEFAVDVRYRIAAGDRARAAAPFFDGDLGPYTAARLEQEMKGKPGKAYKDSRARADADRVRKFLVRDGRFRASFELIAAEPKEDGTLMPVYRISVGPRFAIEATGLTEKAARRDLLALLEGQPFDDDLLQQWVDERRRSLQASGHYRAKVSAELGTSGDPIPVRMNVDEGPKFSVERIDIVGNSQVDSETLHRLVATRPKGLPLVQKGHLTDDELSGDVSAVLGYYQTHGWIAAKVEDSVSEGSKPDRLVVAIRIQEGPRTYVARRAVDGADHLTGGDLATMLSVREGEPFNPRAVRQDVSTLTTYYWNNGWRDASVQDRYTLNEDRTRADVTYRIEEGMRSFFGKTIVRGNAITVPERIMRQVAWKEGEPFSEEKIADTQQNLARTGVFREIQVRPEAADPQTQTRDVNITLAEARRFSLLYGFGYQNSPGADTNRNDVFGIVGGTYRNLMGSMRSASLEIQYAPLSNRGHVFATLLEPYLFNTDFPLTAVAFAAREPIQDVDIERYGGYVESVRFLRRDLRVGLRYEYQQIAPSNPDQLSTIEVEKFPKADLPIKQSAIGPSLFYDRRDDILDPHTGWYATLAGKYAFPFINATATYGKVSAQGAWFRRLFGGVLGVSGRAGAIFPYDEQPGVPPVPIAERFFAGGSATARGFDTDLEGIPRVTVDPNTAAVRNTTDPTGSCAQDFPQYPQLAHYDCNPGPRIIGGNGFMAWSLEYRYPILGNLGISVFYDLAQVWADPKDINFKIEGPIQDAEGKPNLRQGLRQSIGAGLHYLTPIGPLRLEYARPVSPKTIPFDVVRTQLDNGDPCTTPKDVCTFDGGTTKETGRILLSIGYPF